MSIWSQDPNSCIFCVHSFCVGLQSWGDLLSEQGTKRYRWNSLIHMGNSKPTQRAKWEKGEALSGSSPKGLTQKQGEAARWFWQCCNTGSGSLWNGLGAYIGNKTHFLHKNPTCTYILVIPALSLCIHSCAIRGVSGRNTYGRALSTEPCVGGWRCPEGFVRSAAPAPSLPRAAGPQSSPDSLGAGGGGRCVSRLPKVLTGLAAASSTA